MDGNPASPELAAIKGLPGVSHGLATGRDAELIAEQLEKPATQATNEPEQAPHMAAQAEVDWLTRGGAREFQVTPATPTPTRRTTSVSWVRFGAH